ncbi:MAG: hypothetical protein P1P59_09145 [Treponemataceae bacterium]
MDFGNLINAIKDWTPSTIATIAVFILSYFLNLFKKQNEVDAKQNSDFKESLSSGLSRIENKLTKEITEIKAEQKKQAKEIEALKIDKLSREDFYKDMGGWRAEINRLQDLIINQNNATLQKIIEIWKEKK